MKARAGKTEMPDWVTSLLLSLLLFSADHLYVNVHCGVRAYFCYPIQSHPIKAGFFCFVLFLPTIQTPLMECESSLSGMRCYVIRCLRKCEHVGERKNPPPRLLSIPTVELMQGMLFSPVSAETNTPVEWDVSKKKGK